MLNKFRVFSKEEKKMYDVHVISFDNGTIWAKDPNSEEHGRWLNFEEVVLLQSTGFLDKSGTEIFNGDVLMVNSSGLTEVVTYRSDLGMWVSNSRKYGSYTSLCDSHSFGTVVGNRYINPELTEV